jgi:hypothetical protein
LNVKYAKEGLTVYGNLAWARQVATKSLPNLRLQLLRKGLMCEMETRSSLDMIYGGHLRSADAEHRNFRPQFPRRSYFFGFSQKF